MPSVIFQEFQRLAAGDPDRVLVHALSERAHVTAATLVRSIDEITRALDALTIRRAPTIVARIGNRSGLVAFTLAALAREAALLLLDGDATNAELFAVSDRLDADLIVMRAGDHGVGPEHTPLPCALVAVRQPGEAREPWRRPDETGPLLLRTTSGSTGTPRIIVMPEHAVARDGEHLIAATGIEAHDVSLAAVPLSHAYGMGTVLLPLVLQGSATVMRDRFVPARLSDDIAACGISVMPAAPYIFDYLQRLGESARAIARLRLLMSAGAPMPLPVVRYFKKTFGRKIHSLYGTSETGGIAFDASDAVDDPLTVGRALPETSVTIVPVDDAPAGEGRISVRGTAVASRYLPSADPEREAEPQLANGQFLTGDLGTIDGDGRLRVRGRLSPFVNVAGRKVHPHEVEQVIAALDGVEEVSVLGLPDGTRGERLVACVRRADSGRLAVAEVRAACARELSAHKVPRQIVFIDALPRTGRGKTDRRTLEAFVAAALATEETI